jgi:protein-S-isoprenylcysteine O-methyltransferase Ste14
MKGHSGKVRNALTAAAIAAPIGAFLAVILRAPLSGGSTHSGAGANLWRIAPGIALYIAFGIYWDIAAKHASTIAKGESRVSAAFHQALIALSLLLIVLPIPGLTYRFVPASYGFVVLGVAIEVAGIALAVWARRTLGTSWSRAVAITQDHRLIREGPYARVRHPIYSGALLIYLGLAIAVGRAPALLGVALVCVTYWRKIAMEERLLHDAYGSQFDEYRRGSRALIPYVL